MLRRRRPPDRQKVVVTTEVTDDHKFLIHDDHEWPITAWYSNGLAGDGKPFDQLWIEWGHYTSYSGDIEFHGERAIESGLVTLGKISGTVGALYIGKMIVPQEAVRAFGEWLLGEIQRTTKTNRARPEPVLVIGMGGEAPILTVEQWTKLKQMIEVW